MHAAAVGNGTGMTDSMTMMDVFTIMITNESEFITTGSGDLKERNIEKLGHCFNFRPGTPVLVTTNMVVVKTQRTLQIKFKKAHKCIAQLQHIVV